MCAWIAIVVGIAVSFAIKNPVTGTMYQQSVYDLFGQSIPGALIGSILYLVLYRAFIAPKQTVLTRTAK